MNDSNQINTQEDDSIDVIQILKQLWDGRNFIVKTSAVFVVIGVFVALFSPTIYTAETSFIPQLNNSKSPASGLKGLASLAGIDFSNIDSGSNDISPLIYPKLAQSTKFNFSLLSEYIVSYDKPIRIDSHYSRKNSGFSFSKLLGGIKKYTIGLPTLLFSSDDKFTTTKIDQLTLSDKQRVLVEYLKQNISVSLNNKEGYLSITVNDEDPLVATQLTELVTSKLQQDIIQKRLEKANDNLQFVQQQYNAKNTEFQLLQNKLANFKDRNQNISTARFMNNLQRLEAEYSIALKVVQELASQVERAKIQVNRDTPIFTVIEPVVVPNQRSAPKRGLIVTIYMFIGLVFSSGFLLIKDQTKHIIALITSEK